jgi:TonB-dependent starch-binding outer membrane protein SusC
MNILGVSTFGENPAACLVSDGTLRAFCQEERFTRLKGSHGHFPTHSSTWCLRSRGLRLGDVEAFGGRLTLQANWYNARTRDALFLAPSAPSTGESVQLRNVGEIENRGIELRLAGDVYRRPGLNVRLSGSLNTLHNEVVNAGGAPLFSISGFSSSTVQSVVEEGMPVGYLRGSQAILNEDGTIDRVETLQYLGKPLPDRFGTLGVDVTVGPRLRFNASADWQTGAQLHSFNRQFRYLHGLDDPEIPQALLDADRNSNWLNLTNFFVEDTD